MYIHLPVAHICYIIITIIPPVRGCIVPHWSVAVSGSQHAKAVEKYSAALELAPRIRSASNNIITLYNNRR